MSNHSHLTRRDFLKLGGVALGGAALAACKRDSGLVELTAVPPTVRPVATDSHPGNGRRLPIPSLSTVISSR